MAKQYPICLECHVRHDPKAPNLPTDDRAVVTTRGQQVFLGTKEQCQDRVKWIASTDRGYASGLRVQRARLFKSVFPDGVVDLPVPEQSNV